MNAKTSSLCDPMMFINVCITEILSEASIMNLKVNSETDLPNYFLNRYMLGGEKQFTPMEARESPLSLSHFN
jgi:hypothetical protein